MPAHNYVPFYPSDYRGDPGVEALSYAGRGLWTEMYVLMMFSGGLLTYKGRGLRENDLAAIAKATRGETRDVRRILPELRDAKVYSVTEDGIIYSRKLIEQAHKNKQKRDAGKRGGEVSAQANAQARAIALSLEHPLKRGCSTPIQSNPLDTNVSPGNPKKPMVDERDLPRFGDLESDVVAYISNAAAENKTGRLSLGRELGLRRELETLREQLANGPAFAAGLREANARGVANKTYVRKCAEGEAKKGGVQPASRAAFDGIPRD